MTNDSRILLREFKGRLKRHRVDENETRSKLIVDLAFPHFRGRDTRDEQCIRMYDMFYGPKVFGGQHTEFDFTMNMAASRS